MSRHLDGAAPYRRHGGVEFPLVAEFDLPDALLARDTAIRPSGQGLVVLAEGDDGARVLWLGFGDEAFQTVPDLDPGPLAVDRFGQVYAVEGDAIFRLDLGLVQGIIEPQIVREGPVPAPLDVVTSNGMNDLVYGLSSAERGQLVAYTRDLELHDVWILPP